MKNKHLFGNTTILLVIILSLINIILFTSCGDPDKQFIYPDYTQIEEELVSRYNNIQEDLQMPGYYTSGILIHGLNIGEDGKSEVWIHRNMDRNKSVAFSFLRKDNQFRLLPIMMQDLFFILMLKFLLV